MKHKNLTKVFLGLLTVIITGYFCSAFASDYKYKILDPKYNSSIHNYVYDEETATLVETNSLPAKKSNKNWVVALLLVSGVLFYRGVRVLKKIDIGENMENFNILHEFFKVEKVKDIHNNIVKATMTVKDNLLMIKMPQKANINKSNSDLESLKRQIVASKPKARPVSKRDSSIDQYMDNNIEKMKNPMLITTSQLANNKGLCLVEYKGEFSLIGYIDDDIFILNKFDSLTSSEIRARLSETINEKDRYIIRLGEYKALVEVSSDNMQLLLEL